MAQSVEGRADEVKTQGDQSSPGGDAADSARPAAADSDPVGMDKDAHNERPRRLGNVMHNGRKWERRARAAVLLALAGLLSGGSAVAAVQTAQTTMAVSAAVVSVCQVAATPMVFGNYVGTGTTPTDATGTIQVVCNPGTPYQVGLDGGTGGGNTSVRKMKSADSTNALNYTLSQNASHTTNWGNNPPTDTKGGIATGNTDTLTVYGEIPAGQASPTGAYTDTVTVTLSF